MQLAILLVLIVIAVILAPWLLGVIAVLAAAYGVWLVAGIILTAAFALIGLVIYIVRISFAPRDKISSSSEFKIAEANRLYRERESLQRAADAESELKSREILARTNLARTMVCKNCSESIKKNSLYCPNCGKPPI